MKLAFSFPWDVLQSKCLLIFVNKIFKYAIIIAGIFQETKFLMVTSFSFMQINFQGISSFTIKRYFKSNFEALRFLFLRIGQNPQIITNFVSWKLQAIRYCQYIVSWLLKMLSTIKWAAKKYILIWNTTCIQKCYHIHKYLHICSKLSELSTANLTYFNYASI